MHNTKIRGVIADIFYAGAATSLWGAIALGAVAIGLYGIEIIATEVNVTKAYNWQGLKNSRKICIGGSLVSISCFLGNTVIEAAIHEDEENK